MADSEEYAACIDENDSSDSQSPDTRGQAFGKQKKMTAKKEDINKASKNIGKKAKEKRKHENISQKQNGKDEKSVSLKDKDAVDTSSNADSESVDSSSFSPKKKKRLSDYASAEKRLNKSRNKELDAFIPENIRQPKSKEWYLSDKVSSYLESRIRKPLDKDVRNRMRSECPRPFSEDKAFTTPEVDTEVLRFTGKNSHDLQSGIERAWRGCQDRLLDAIGPLAKILEMGEEAKESKNPIDPDILAGWAQRAICFMGNANCSLSAERRKSILLKISPHLIKTAVDEPGTSAQGCLFGQKFVKKIARYVDGFESLDTSKASTLQFPDKHFSRAGRGRGRSFRRAAFRSPRGSGQYRETFQDDYTKSPTWPPRGRSQRGRGKFAETETQKPELYRHAWNTWSPFPKSIKTPRGRDQK